MKNFQLRKFTIVSTNLIRKMKMTFLLLVLFISGVMANNAVSQVARVSFSLQGATVAQAMETIESQTDYLFVYNKMDVDVTREVTLSVNNKSVAEVLNLLFRNTDVIYAMEGSNIMLMVSRDMPVQQQDTTKGKVTDKSGNPLPGVTVILKGTTTGTITGADGTFTISSVALRICRWSSPSSVCRPSEVVVSGP
jgi:TonB-dependent starch-binding outer membrane protein SusC